MAHETLGNALTGSFAVSGGRARLYENGLTIDGDLAQVEVHFDFPSIGNPNIAVGTPASAKAFESSALTYLPGGWNLEALSRAITQACAERVALRATGRADATPIPLQFGAPEQVLAAASGRQATYGLPTTAQLEERQLYDVAVLTDQSQWETIAPHVLYFRSSWSDFGIAHITDLHISRRVDSFRQRLETLGRHEAAQKMHNWNDRVRGFIRYANHLHAIGVLDVILATGDFIDYLYEDNDDPNGGGNAFFARQILLGRAAGPHFANVEELRVPIFITAGNHDYRKHPYKLAWEVDLGPGNISRHYHYSGFHLLREDAIALNGGVSELSAESAKRLAKVDPDIEAFGKHLAKRRSYAVALGPHRIVMLDSSWDLGIINASLDVILSLINEVPEDKLTFLDGTPNSEGVGAKELKLAVDTLAETPTDGLFILGIHAPLFNLWQNASPPFLRETQRAANEDQVLGFLARHDGDKHRPADEIKRNHPTWFLSDRDHREQSFVKRGNTSDLLDFGVSRGAAENLLRQLAGLAPARRPATLVLQGHTHNYNEFRLGHEGNELLFYTDYYTHNPSSYHACRFLDGGLTPSLGPSSDVAYVEIEPGSPAVMQPTRMPYEAYHRNVVAVPPYPKTLAATINVRDWWEKHQPLFLQTGPLAPLDSSQVSFTGFRVITVKSNLIDKIHFVSMDKLHARDYEVKWEDLVSPDTPRRYLRLPRSRVIGAPDANSAPVGFIATNGVHDIVYRDKNGYLHEVWRYANGGTGHGNLSSPSSAPKATGNPFVYLVAPATQNVLYRGADNQVYCLYWTNGAPGHENLTGSVRAPSAAGDPVGYFTPPTGIHHVFYRKSDGHLHALWWQGQSAGRHSGLTADALAPPATGTPSAFLDTKQSENIICYRATDGHIHTVYFTDGPFRHANLSGFAHAPGSAGDPFAFYTAHNDTKQIAYRGQDRHIHELYWAGNAPVEHWDVSALAQAPAAASDPVSFYHAPTKTNHVIYSSIDGHMIDLLWTRGGQPTYVDLSVMSRAPPGVDKPSAFSSENARHVFYRTADGLICEIQDRVPALERVPGDATPPIIDRPPVEIGRPPR